MKKQPHTSNNIKLTNTTETRSADGAKVSPPPRIIKKNGRNN